MEVFYLSFVFQAARTGPAEISKWIVRSQMYSFRTLNNRSINEPSMFPDLNGVANHGAWWLTWRML
jgi:hypothetical protein